jgi:hypothetical protein
LAERSERGDASVFFTHPICASILALSFLLLILPVIFKLVRRD